MDRALISRLAAAAAAFAWPFVLADPMLHRAGVRFIAVALIGLSLTVALGWLRSVPLFQPAAAAAGACATGWLLAGGQTVLVALPAAVLAGAVLAWSTVSVSGRGATGLRLTVVSLGVTVLLWAVVLPRVTITPFARPVLVGVDLSGDRPLYLAGVLLLALVIMGVGNVARAPVGHRLVATGVAPAFAARSGIDAERTVLTGFAASGALAGLAGCVFALQQQGLPPPTAFSPALAVAYLAIPLVGGMSRVTGALLGAGAFVALPLVLPGRPSETLVGATLVAIMLVARPPWRQTGLAALRR